MEPSFPPASELIQEVKKKLTHREEVELKKQAQREQEEAECTFKPKLTAKTTPFKGLPKNSSSVSSPNPIDLAKHAEDNVIIEQKVKNSPSSVINKQHDRNNKKQVELEKVVTSTTPVKITAESINRLHSGVGSGHVKPHVVEQEEVKVKKLHSADLDVTVQRLFSEADKLKARSCKIVRDLTTRI